MLSPNYPQMAKMVIRVEFGLICSVLADNKRCWVLTDDKACFLFGLV